MSQKSDSPDESVEEKQQEESEPVEEEAKEAAGETEEEEMEEQSSVEGEVAAEKSEEEKAEAEEEEEEEEEEAAKTEEEEIEIVEERVYTIPFRRVWTTPSGKRTPRASRMLRDFVRRHMKTEDVHLSNEVNEELWARSISKPPRQIKVRVVKDKEGKVIVYPATAA
jgi:large subunit ribosomal protein L31e